MVFNNVESTIYKVCDICTKFKGVISISDGDATYYACLKCLDGKSVEAIIADARHAINNRTTIELLMAELETVKTKD